MQVAYFQASLEHIFAERFGHFFRQRGDQRALAFRRNLAAFGDNIINLTGRRTHHTFRVNQPGWSHHLFAEHAAGAFQLPWAGGCRYENCLRPETFPFFKF